MIQKDSRIKLVNEVLNGIKASTYALSYVHMNMYMYMYVMYTCTSLSSCIT